MKLIMKTKVISCKNRAVFSIYYDHIVSVFVHVNVLFNKIFETMSQSWYWQKSNLHITKAVKMVAVFSIMKNLLLV